MRRSVSVCMVAVAVLWIGGCGGAKGGNGGDGDGAVNNNVNNNNNNSVPPNCGDGVLNPGEQCDEGINNSDAPNALCRTNCLSRRCGDGIVDPGFGETCDDGNQTSGDGCSSACAAEPAAWVQRNPSNSPAARECHAMVFDESRGRVVLFGGFYFVGTVDAYFGDTWEHDGSNWVQVNTTASPAARAYHAMAWDSARQRTVLFGGYYFDGNTHYLDDTWEYNGSNWVQVTTASSPDPREGHVMAFDPGRARVVLFGGYFLGGGPRYHSDTWEYDGSNWVQISPSTSPPMRHGSAMVFDSARSRVMLFGGFYYDGVNNTYYADTWVYNGTAWSNLTGGTAPQGREGHAMAFDTQRGRAVMFGGYFWNGNVNVYLADTWEHDGSAWQSAGGSGPAGRFGHAMVYDTMRAQVILFGGASNTGSWQNFGDTWTYGY